MNVSFTIDLEDPSERYEPEGRYAVLTRQILDLCDARKIRATFFTVGRVAMAAPRLIQEIASRGHEVGYHSHAHVPLTKESPARFRSESREDKDRIEHLIGKRITGFRAPAFSLMPHTMWALDILAEFGFEYSSSIMPTRISRYGFPVVPRTPFRWPNKMLELPLPVATPIGIPYLGGIYMFAQPIQLVKWWAQQAKPEEVLWTYAHPYDFDREEKFSPRLHGSLFASTVLWAARRVTEKKINQVLDFGSAPTLGERAAQLTSPDTHS